MRSRIYIDTSVIGGCCDHEFAEFRSGIKIAVVSDLTLRELEDAPQSVRDILSSIQPEHVEDVSLNNESIVLSD